MSREREIADTILSSMTKEERDYIKNVSQREYVHIIIHFTRNIRNEFGLWNEDNELTLGHPDYKEDIIDGVDHNPRHPDQVSSDIARIVLEDIGIKLSESIYKRLL